MQRDPKQREMFLGREVENSPFKGKATLFVAGVWSNREVLEAAKADDLICHIYLGANQSWEMRSALNWLAQANALVTQGYCVTIDWPLFLFNHLEEALLQIHFIDPKYNPLDYLHFMLFTKMQGVNTVNAQMTIKIDDDVRKVVNPGVWCIRVPEVVNDTNFTPWSAYADDKGI